MYSMYVHEWMAESIDKFHFHRCRVQSFHLHVQLPALSSQVDVIHSLCASLNGLDMSLDSYKYNHSSLTIKCTVLCFRLMFFIYIEKNAWAAFPFSVVFSFRFSLIFLFLLQLILSVLVAVFFQLQTRKSILLFLQDSSS